MNRWKTAFRSILVISVLTYGFFIPPIIADVPPLTYYRQLIIGDKPADGELVHVRADKSAGFNYDYYIFIPDSVNDDSYMLVEPNNTGGTDDDISVHESAVLDDISSGKSHRLARELGTPLLMPVFPRPASDWRIYVHALDRDSILLTDGDMARVDRQLIAMIDDAKTRLTEKGCKMKEKIFMNGFSASGSFVNRFTALYPQMVKAAAAGGVNSMPILPLENLEDDRLTYPIGVAENREITGASFDSEAYSEVFQFIYMGSLDDNDTLPYDDAFNEDERQLIKKVMGEEMSERWKLAELLYAPYLNSELKLYEGVGHTITDEIYEDLTAFFNRAAD